MTTSPNEDGRPTQGGAAAPVHVMNPISVSLTGTIPGTVEIANDVGAPVPTTDVGNSKGAGVVDGGTQRVVLASDGPTVTVLGATTDAGVVTDANGSISAKLRGLVTMLLQVALGDATTNPTIPRMGTFIHGFNGATWDRLRVANIQKDLATVTITTITTVWTPTSGKKFRLMGGTISVSAAGSVLFEDNAAGTTIFRTPKLAADTPYTFVCSGGQGKLSATADNVLKATLSVAGAITGTLWGTEE